MKIAPASLSEEEKAMADLLNNSQLNNSQQQIFDFKVDNTVTSIETGVYQLVDGKWQEMYGFISEGISEFNGKGRIAVSFDDLKTQAHISIQNRENGSIIAGGSYQQNEEKSQCKARGFVFLSNEQPIVYDEANILAIQIGTDKSQLRTSSSYIEDPSRLAEYEEVYALGIIFN